MTPNPKFLLTENTLDDFIYISSKIEDGIYEIPSKDKKWVTDCMNEILENQEKARKYDDLQLPFSHRIYIPRLEEENKLLKEGLEQFITEMKTWSKNPTTDSHIKRLEGILNMTKEEQSHG